MPIPLKTQQIMCSQYVERNSKHSGTDIRHAYITGLVHGHGMATRQPLLGPDHSGMRVAYGNLLDHAAAKCSDATAAKSLLMLKEHLNELGCRYYAGDLKVVDEFLQLYRVAPGERADATFDQAHPAPVDSTASEEVWADTANKDHP